MFNIYGFINGLSTLIATNPSWINNLYPLNSITLCVDTYYNNNNQMTTYKFNGNISQPLITTNSKYNITGFVPQWNLKPSNMSNVLFWLDNGIDNYSYQSITLNKTVKTSIINNSLLPIITLNGNNPFYLLINNTFTDPGVSAQSYLTGTNIACTTSGTVDITTLGTYNITYTATDSYGTSTITRTVYVIDTLNTTNIYYNTNNGYFTSINNFTISNSNNTYTFEVWVYLNSGSGRNILFDSRGSGYSSNIFAFGIFNNYTTSSTAFNQMTGSIQIQVNKWTHLAWVINYPTVTVYVNGKLDLSYNSDLNYIVGELIIANNNERNALFKGYIYNASIHKSIKYTSNFTPASPIKITTDTIFYLGNDYKNSINNTTLSTFGTITTDIIPTIQYYSNNLIDITLNGKDTSVLIYSTYTELGVVAKDIFGNTLTYTTSGTVNTDQLGTYTITYTVSNIYGTFTATRNVIVLLSLLPSSINDVFFWLDANDSSTIIKDGSDNITLITDKSNNKINMIPYYGNPQILSNGINNLQTLKINNNGLISSTTFPNFQNFTIAIVLTITQTNDWGLIFGHYPTNNWDSAMEFRVVSGSNLVEIGGNSSARLETIYNVPLLYIITRTNSVVNMSMINLNNNTTITMTPQVPVSLLLGNYNLFIGKFTNISAYYGNYNIGEIIYWNKILSINEQTDIINYLTNKWNNSTNKLNNSTISIKPILTLTGPSIIYLQLNDTYNEFGITAKDLFNNNISTYTTTGTIDNTTIGQYILTYTATDIYGVSNSIIRTININQNTTTYSYNITNGWLGPLLNNFNILNNNNWTIEAWINQSYIQPSSNYIVLFDFRSYPYIANNYMAIILSTDYKLGLLTYTGQTYYTTITYTLNQWTHIACMRLGPNIYGFINGVCNLLCSNQSTMDNLTNLNSLVIGADSNIMTTSNNTKNNLNKFNGYISQPLITTNARYNVEGFIPQWILKTLTTSNILFWLNNTIETISNKFITFQNTVNSNIIINPIKPTITLNGSSTINLPINASYTELGATVNYILNPTLTYTINGTVNISTLGTYILTYTTTDNLASATRTVNVLNIIDITTYDTTNGSLQLTGLNFNSMNNTDWTCEVWINMRMNNSDNRCAIFDFRQPGQINTPSTHMLLAISNNKPIIQCFTNLTLIGATINSTVPFNQWSHVTWMRKSNIIYTFINGIASPGEVVPSYLNNLSGLNYMVQGTWADLINSSIDYGVFIGQLYHPLITLGAKYNTNGFIPQADLTPNDYSNVLYFLNNDLEIKSNQQIVFNKSVSKTTISITSNNLINASSKVININAYNLQNGYFLVNTPTINMTEWTIEAYIYRTLPINSNFFTIFDFRPNGGQGTANFSINTSNQLMIYYNDFYNFNTRVIPLNSWTHICFMCKNNVIYAFVDGYVSSNSFNISNLSYIYQLLIGENSSGSYPSLWKYYGYISQPLIVNYAKYTTSNFIPNSDLTPLTINNSIIIFINNNFQTFGNLSSYTLNNPTNNIPILYRINSNIQNLTITTTPTINSSISLNGSYNLYLLLNTNYYELGALAKANNNISSYTVSGNVNTTNIGQYTLTYTINDKSINRIVNIINNSITINPKSSYTLNNGWLGSIKNTYNLNDNDWTFEIWLNCSSYSSSYAFIFDTGSPTTTSWTGKLGLCINSSGYLYIYTGSNNSYIQVSQLQISLNKWTHLVWMKSSTNIYSFINGICSSATTVYSQLNTLTQFNNMSFGCSVNDSTNASYRFNGILSQPLISLYTKYDINGFIPQWDLTPINNTNILLYLNNDFDIITNQSILFNNNITKTILYNIPYTSSTLSLIGNNNYNISLNSIYIEPGVINTSFNNQNIPVYITSIKNNNNELLTNNILVDGKMTNININTSSSSIYTITYSSVDNNGLINNITRTINITNNLPILSYDVSNGFLGPIIKNNLNKINWTIECWVYQTTNNNNNNTPIFDFRYTNSYNDTYSFYTYINNNTRKIGIWASNSGGFSTSTSSNNIELNKWTHLVWMCYNNNLYAFVNGVCTLIGTNQSWTSNLISLNSITIGIDVYWKYYNNTNNLTNNKYYGIISQPLIIKNAKYNINGFIPKWDLKPYLYSDVIFWLDNNIDKISSQTINLQNNVIQNFLTTSPILPIITLNGPATTYISVDNIYTDSGVTVYYPLNPSIIVYITSIVDQNNNEYITTPLNALTTNTITNLNTNLLNYIYTITYSVTDIYNNIVVITRTLLINLIPIGVTSYNTSKPGVYANSSIKTSNTIYYYAYNNYAYVSTDFVKFINNSDIIYYMDSNQVVPSNIVTTDSNGILWTTIGLITMQVYNPMNYSINYNSNTYSLYCNPNILLMSNGIYKNNNGSDYIYQYNNNWYFSIDMITYYQILFDSTNTLVQGVSSNIIYVYNNMVLTTQPTIHTINNINYWIFGIMRVNPNNLSDCCLYYNNTIYTQASPEYSISGGGTSGSTYIPTYTAPDWPKNINTINESISNYFRNSERFDSRVILFIMYIGFVTGINKFSLYDSGITTNDMNRSETYKINDNGTLDSVNIFNCFWTGSGHMFSSKSGYMTTPGNNYGPGLNNHSVSDGSFKLVINNPGFLTITRLSDNFTKSFNYLSIIVKRVDANSFQFVIWIVSSSNFDPHASFDCSPYFNKGGFGYISFETNSYFSSLAWNGDSGYMKAPSWNGDTKQFVNGPISVSCKNLNSCGYINPKCLENYILSGPIMSATNIILTQTIADAQNNNITVINGQPTAVSVPISNYHTVGFPSLIYSYYNWYAIAVPASRTPFYISNVNSFIPHAGNTFRTDLSYTGQFITNVLSNKFWNNY